MSGPLRANKKVFFLGPGTCGWPLQDFLKSIWEKNMSLKKAKKIVLAYSGGLDTSVILKWLKNEYKAEIIAYCADVGQADELGGLEEKAKNTGASKIYIEDLKDEFVKDYVFPALQAHAVYERRYMLGTSLARPVIAKRQVEIALKEGADAVAHGATGKGNDQVRFELAFKSLAPQLTVIAPWREWSFTSRTELIDYAKANGIPVPVTKTKPYSSDRNLLHISYEGGVLEDPFFEPNEDMFILTKPIDKTPDKPLYLEVTFSEGIPTAVDGKKMSPVELLSFLNKCAGEHGVGRVDIVENRLVGIKSRGVYETPGGTVLYLAHLDLEAMVLDKDTMHFKEFVAQKFAELAYNGLWFHPLREALQAFISYTQKSVNGTVRVKLWKGNCIITGRKAERSLYNPDLATFEKDSIYNQFDAEGFINLFGLQSKMLGLLKKK
jgi:argininosuccinate synthase